MWINLMPDELTIVRQCLNAASTGSGLSTPEQAQSVLKMLEEQEKDSRSETYLQYRDAAFDQKIRNGVLDGLLPGDQLTPTSGSVDKWGVKTETLVRVNTLLASPNHWDGQTIGNKHWFFVLKDCINPDPARGIYNEFLKGELEPHRKVFEVLGAKTKCPPSADQLSGIGFSSTRKDAATVVVKGRTINSTFNIQF